MLSNFVPKIKKQDYRAETTTIPNLDVANCDIEASNMCRIESGNTNLTVKTMATIPLYRLL